MEKFLLPTKPERDRVYCCMKKLGKCKKRLEKKTPKPKVLKSSLAEAFKHFVGNDINLFDEQDTLCPGHHIKVKNSSEKLEQSRKWKLSSNLPPPAFNRELRSGRVIIGDISTVHNSQQQQLTLRVSQNSNSNEVSTVHEDIGIQDEDSSI